MALVAAVAVVWGTVARSPTALVAVGPQQTVHSVSGKIGIHTRLCDEVEEWKIKRSLEMVREMGASWIVEYFPWGYYEPEKGRFDWSHPDMVVSHAAAQGLTVVARLGFVPEWARPKDTPTSYLDADRYVDFGDYVYAFVRHFSGRVHYLVLWNEPNLTTEWGNRQPDPIAYSEMLRIAYQRAKDADPSVIVLGGALAPTLEEPGSPAGVSDLWYLREMYKAGAGAWFDALAIHAYGWGYPPEDDPDPDRVNYRRAELLRWIMIENGDEGKVCLITEAGWNDHPRWTKAVSVSARARHTVEAYRLAEASWPWCESVSMWVLRFPRPQKSYQDAFTFVSSSFQPRPVYSAVQQYATDEP